MTLAPGADSGRGFRLRPATRRDQAAIRGLIRAVHINPLGIRWRRFILAVDHQGGLVGCGQVKPHADGSRELASIAVVEAWRGRGVASAVIRHLMAAAPPPLWLTCRDRLIPFYERFGFRTVEPGQPMPPYFRRILRLARILIRARGLAEGPGVMVWQESSSNDPGRS